METSVAVRDTPLPHKPRPGPVFIEDIEELHRLPVQDCGYKPSATVVDKLERKERDILVDQAEKDLVPLPDIELPDPGYIHPFQLPLIAGDGLSLEAVCSEQMHIFRDAVP